MPASSTFRGVSASPASTGGAGPVFEQQVGAYWLSLLLVRAFAPILRGYTVVEVHFQTERLGWATDDALVLAENDIGERRQLACQVKRTFTVTASDDGCRKAICDFWTDFQSGRLAVATDRLVLVTLRGTNALLGHFVGLLDCARFARDGAEFESRLATPGLLSKDTVRHCRVIQEVIGETETGVPAIRDLWSFLRVLHVLSLDLGSSTRQSEAMVKSLLAYTASGSTPEVVADSTWDALLHEAGEAIPAPRSYRYCDLPESLRQRHSPTGTMEGRILQALKDHSAPVIDQTHETIGSACHVDRPGLVQRSVSGLEAAQVLLISGPAGSGKSALAKEVVHLLEADHFAFCFRSEEFARPHFDEVLLNGQIPTNGVQLGAILAGQGRKVLLVESLERLLESSTRDALSDLLRILSRDGSWRLVLTCRDYSADIVRSAFLEPAGVVPAVIDVPGLTDEELARVQKTYPQLSGPLSNSPLRTLLRNPYYLDKALLIPWPEDRALPATEHQFRERFWQDIVRDESRNAGGMPHRRGQAFLEIALRRARALTPYVPTTGLDLEAIERLQQDSLVAGSGQNKSQVAPAHDVLEDWAILRWIGSECEPNAQALGALAAQIGSFPALRRAYRKWVAELLESDASTAHSLFEVLVTDPSIGTHFRDDTLLAILQAPGAAQFLEHRRTALLANDKGLLRRIMHLTRVGCVSAHDRFAPSPPPSSVSHIPSGEAWAAILGVVQTDFESFSSADRPLLLGFLEDWAKGIAWWSPYPEGAESAAGIAYSLLAGSGGYRQDEERKRILRVIARIPKGAPDRFLALLSGDASGQGQERSTEDLCQMILENMEGMPACRDFPEAVIKVALDHLLLKEGDLKDRWAYGERVDLEPLFGLSDRTRLDYFPASAYRGPFLALLQHHPREGLDFHFSLFNHSAEWYAHPRVPKDSVEPPYEIALAFADGSTHRQWCNPRLWNLYRGTSVGPYVLQSALMALELWLLEVADAHPKHLDSLLLAILRKCDSAAVTAVVASVATASPRPSGETLLTLLGSSECILLDRQRMAHESGSLTGLFPLYDVRAKVYEEERKLADARPHRKMDLEGAILSLQLGPLAERVQVMLDRHRDQLPAAAAQTEDDKIWRLALQRMDLRQYSVSEASAPEQEQPPTAPSEAPKAERRLLLTPADQDPDLREMVGRSVAQSESVSRRLGLMNWARRVFTGEDVTTDDVAQWHDRLREARESEVTHDDPLGQGGPGFTAAICIRDHWDELSPPDQQWCVLRICDEVQRESDKWDHLARVQRAGMLADRPAAWILPALLGKSTKEPLRRRVRKLLPIALTHAINEVRLYAAIGVGAHLWAIDRDLAVRSANALAAAAFAMEQAWNREKRRPREGRRTYEAFEAAAARSVRKCFYRPGGIPDEALAKLDASTWIGAEASSRVLRLLLGAPHETVTMEAFARLATTLVHCWDDEHEQSSPRRQRNYETERDLQHLLEDYLLRADSAVAVRVLEPILTSIDDHRDEAAEILKGVVYAEDRQRAIDRFWAIWRLFANRVRRAGWLSDIDNDRFEGRRLIEALFLGVFWKDDVRHWQSLDGHAEELHELFLALPPSATALDNFLRFLYDIGERSLPRAFVPIATRLKDGDPIQMLRKANTSFMLEVLLQRYVYGQPLELKRNPLLRTAVLDLLDVLVESGSSAAFRMRDDFVTPAVSPNVF